MHGLIFVTWEKYLAERFGGGFLNDYRAFIGETSATAPLASRMYDDATLVAGVGAACKLSGFSTDLILREYGHYFILNSLTSHLCAYLLRQVHSGRDLLFTMSSAHAQMRRTTAAVTPPVFGYEILSADQNNFILIYDSNRKLCPVLLGAIEGAADRYGEQVRVVERSCMKHDAPACRFEVRFVRRANSTGTLWSPERQAQEDAQQQLANLVLAVLPEQGGVTLPEIQHLMLTRYQQMDARKARVSALLEALQQLQYAGLVSSGSNQPGSDVVQRRYWRASTEDT